MAHWYLFDYGMVISQAPEAADWQRLQDLSGQDLSGPESSYWAAREDYDAGRLDVTEYWKRVLGQEELDEERVNALHEADLAAWSHLNPRTEVVLTQLRAMGSQLALLSNMPSAMASHYADTSPWVGAFDRLFFSGHLNLVKPDPRIYQHVLDELSARGEDVTFIDDRQENLDAAARLGMTTVLHHPGVDLAAELGVGVEK